MTCRSSFAEPQPHTYHPDLIPFAWHRRDVVLPATVWSLCNVPSLPDPSSCGHAWSALPDKSLQPQTSARISRIRLRPRTPLHFHAVRAAALPPVADLGRFIVCYVAELDPQSFQSSICRRIPHRHRRSSTQVESYCNIYHLLSSSIARYNQPFRKQRSWQPCSSFRLSTPSLPSHLLSIYRFTKTSCCRLQSVGSL